ncbi:MAG: ABC transporter ATP-binding protein [Desulfobacteraceae bacterium]|nr:MAG: ABC transporter ATP-binding protein [Desulfobacteraceae bacterium]
MEKGAYFFLQRRLFMTSEAAIVFDDVHKTYVSEFKRRKSKALTGLTFQVEKGQVFGIVGPNGAGKSTALKILLGFLKHDAGKVQLAVLDPKDPGAHRTLGYLPENPCLYEHLSAKDHLKFSARIHRMPSKETKTRIDQVLEMVDLAHAAGEPIRSYSKGMTQRAALAYALFHNPEILILDEPMSGLDPLGRQLVVRIIQDYHQTGRTILFCSHVLTDVERICDQIGVMNKGTLAAVIAPQELVKNQAQAAPPNGASPLESFFMQTVQAEATRPA